MFNGETFLEEMLDGLASQVFTDFRVYISDNGSDDATPDICARFANRDDRISYVRHPVNRGVAWNFRETLGGAQTDFFTWIAADDVPGPRYLEQAVELLDSRPEVTFSLTPALAIDARGNEIGPLAPPAVYAPGPSAHCSPFHRVRRCLRDGVSVVLGYGGVMRTSAVRFVGGYPQVPWGGEVSLAAALAAEGPWEVCPHTGFYARVHEGQTWRSDFWTTNREQGGRGFPVLRQNLATFRMISRSTPPVHQRVAATAAAVRFWSIPHRRMAGGDFRDAKQRLRSGWNRA